LSIQKIIFISFVISLAFTNLNAKKRTQIIELKTGWNAVYLEVEPEINSQNLSEFIINSTGKNSFQEVPIEIISTYSPLVSSIEYIVDPSEENYKKPSWNIWINDSRQEAFLTNLFGLTSNNSYLIKSSSDFNWSVEGEVIQKEKKWEANSFNFVGFDVTSNGISFETLFSETDALKETVVYKLVDSKWYELDSSEFGNELIKKNSSYWVFADGATDFNGILEVKLSNTKINFLNITDVKTVELKNTSSKMPLNVNLELINNDVPLYLVSYDENMSEVKTEITGAFKSVKIPENSSEKIRFAVRGIDIPENTNELTGLLKITTDETQEEKWVSIYANTSDGFLKPTVSEILTGLWFVYVEMNKVNELHSSSTDTLTPKKTPYGFNLQMILHSDSNGNTKLLKEVYVMQTDDQEVDENKTFVLLTDETKIMDYKGIVLKKGELVPVRFMTPSFDFAENQKYIELTGSIKNETGATIKGNISYPKEHPTNPFRHQFHPVHKWGRDFNRTISFDIQQNITDSVIQELTATYFEEIEGVHKSKIRVSGDAKLILITDIPNLTE
jgi:hypothetical protein